MLKHMPSETRTMEEKHVKLFRNGRNQAVRIPVDFELPGDEAMMRRDGDRLILEPLHKGGLVEWLAQQKPWEGEFPELDERQAPPEDVDL